MKARQVSKCKNCKIYILHKNKKSEVYIKRAQKEKMGGGREKKIIQLASEYEDVGKIYFSLFFMGCPNLGILRRVANCERSTTHIKIHEIFSNFECDRL